VAESGTSQGAQSLTLGRAQNRPGQLREPVVVGMQEKDNCVLGEFGQLRHLSGQLRLWPLGSVNRLAPVWRQLL
jgi:hypothetical protein